MREPTPDARALEATALHYAARDLSAAEAEAFEIRLAGDQAARDALAEAVRLSAAALGQAPPAPDGSFRALIRDRLRPLVAWHPRWLTRRAYRGHPLAWAGAGAVVVAGATLVGLRLAEPDAAHTPVATVRPALPAAPAPAVLAAADELVPPREGEVVVNAVVEPHAAVAESGMSLRAAEIWAELSTPDHVEKTHEEDARWRQRVRDFHPNAPALSAREP